MMSIFWQHAVLAAISGASLIIAAKIGVSGNRRMARIEVKLNGRIDAFLEEIAAARDKPPTKGSP